MIHHGSSDLLHNTVHLSKKKNLALDRAHNIISLRTTEGLIPECTAEGELSPKILPLGLEI